MFTFYRSVQVIVSVPDASEERTDCMAMEDLEKDRLTEPGLPIPVKTQATTDTANNPLTLYSNAFLYGLSTPTGGDLCT